MKEQLEYKKIRECLGCGGEILAKRQATPIQDTPYFELKEYHKKDCPTLPVIIPMNHV
jgi:hypothetical protein